jgi:transposase
VKDESGIGFDRQELEKLAAEGAMITIPASLLLQLIVTIERHEQEIAELKRNSRTSSKPPSSDRNNPNKPAPKKRKLKGKQKRKQGGQKGHPGATLRKVDNPGYVITHRIQGKCPHCQAGHKHIKINGEESRQVFDLPVELRLEVIEHRREVGECQCCAKKIKASYPEEIKAPVQYGQRMQALVLYLQSYQLLPCERLSDLIGDLWGCPISTGTISKMLTHGGTRAGPIADAIKQAVRASEFIHSDETGLSVKGKLHWLHTASTPTLTWLHIDPHRGVKALRAMEVLEGYGGVVIHDYLSAYYRIEGLSHALCNAHHLRDLDCVTEEQGQSWSAAMRAYLLEVKKRVERERSRGKEVRQKTIDRLKKDYFKILEEGCEENPEPERKPGQRGRLKRGKALNLLNRFWERSEEVMAFLLKGMPFDNNEAERDLRMMKVKQKIRGCFRSLSQSEAFVKVRSVIATAKKRKINVLEMLQITLKVLTPPSTALTLLNGYKISYNCWTKMGMFTNINPRETLCFFCFFDNNVMRERTEI